MSNVEHPMSGPHGERFDVDLGDGHWIEWTTYKDVRCGGIITHRSDKTETGYCSGAFWIDSRYNEDCGTQHAIWQMTGTFECPTLSPSFLCHCGDHGWVRDGKWIQA
jgi:hypothetical protein